MEGSKPLGKVVGYVAGVILAAVGVALILSMILSMMAYVSATASIGGMFPSADNSTVIAVIAAEPVEVTVSSYVGFKIATASVSSLPQPNKGVAYHMSPPLFAYLLNASSLNYVDFVGNYTSFTTTLRPGEALLIWPYQSALPYSYISYKYHVLAGGQQAPDWRALLFLAPILLIGAAMVYGGVVLIRWSRK